MKLWISVQGKVIEHQLKPGEYTIGRDETNVIAIPDQDISRHHCKLISHDDGRLEILDRGSTNGTFVNGLRVRQAYVYAGDTIQIADSLLILGDNSKAIPGAADSSRPTSSYPARFRPSEDALPELSGKALEDTEDPDNNEASGSSVAPEQAARSSEAHKTPVPGQTQEPHQPTRSKIRSLLRERVQQLILVSQHIAAELDLKRLLDTILNAVIEFTTASRGMIFLARETEKYQFALGVNIDNDAITVKERVFLEHLLDDTKRARDLVVLHQPPKSDEDQDGRPSLGQNSCLCLPLIAASRYQWDNQKERRQRGPKLKIYGFIYLDSAASELELNAGDRQLLKAIASQAAVALQTAHLYRQATLDPLTGLLNRETFRRKLQDELKAARIKQSALSVIMLDLDHFKQVNDSYGHPAGDEVLKDVSARLKQNLRDDDIIARYGGEEFILCLPETGREGAQVVAEKLRMAINSKPVGGDLELTVSSSLGISIFPNQATTSDILIKRADQALYEAKRRGRNQFIMWTDKIDRLGHQNDPLAGLLSGNIMRDERNVQLFFSLYSLMNLEASDKGVFDRMAANIVESTRADRAFLYFGEDPSSLKIVGSFVHTSSDLTEDDKIYEGPLHECLTKQRLTCTENLENLEPPAETTPELDSEPKQNLPVSTVLAVPMLIRQKILGALYLEFCSHHKSVTSADLSLYEALGEQLAIALYPWYVQNGDEALKPAQDTQIERLKKQVEKLRIENIQLKRATRKSLAP